jgi:hypothetical protein
MATGATCELFGARSFDDASGSIACLSSFVVSGDGTTIGLGPGDSADSGDSSGFGDGLASGLSPLFGLS